MTNPADIISQFDPYFVRVLDISISRELIEYSDKSRFGLTSSGRQRFHEIVDLDVFGEERAFLGSVAPHLSEALVDRMLHRVRS